MLSSSCCVSWLLVAQAKRFGLCQGLGDKVRLQIACFLDSMLRHVCDMTTVVDGIASLLLKGAVCLQVFEEVSNLCLGLAARAMPWSSFGQSHTIAVWVILVSKVFDNLIARSKSIAESLRARGVVDPSTHHLNVPVLLQSSWPANFVAAGSLLMCGTLAVMNDPAFARI